MQRLLTFAILLMSTLSLRAQGQQQNVAKLNANARNLVGIIGSDKTKTLAGSGELSSPPTSIVAA
jgi:hypothetical protein